MRRGIIARTRRSVEEVLADEDSILPSDKRAAVNIIELRTKLEIRTLMLRISFGISMAVLTGAIVKWVFG